MSGLIRTPQAKGFAKRTTSATFIGVASLAVYMGTATPAAWAQTPPSGTAGTAGGSTTATVGATTTSASAGATSQAATPPGATTSTAAGAPPASPSGGSAAPAAGSGPSGAPPASGRSSDDGSARYYVPRPEDPNFASAPLRRARPLYVLSALVDAHFAFAPTIARLGSVGGVFQSVETEIRLRFGSPMIGVTVGVLAPNGSLGLGLDFFRYAGIPLGKPTGNVTWWLSPPTVEARVFVHPNVPHQGMAAFGSSLLGVRAVVGDVPIDIRFPRFDLWIGPFNDSMVAWGTMGVGGSVGFVF